MELPVLNAWHLKKMDFLQMRNLLPLEESLLI